MKQMEEELGVVYLTGTKENLTLTYEGEVFERAKKSCTSLRIPSWRCGSCVKKSTEPLPSARRFTARPCCSQSLEDQRYVSEFNV
ncbi:hypothetical protein PO124_30455 [Bacillus licheniformis]|nr:hypothetical protein [Bacillus licheniformis]